MLPERNVLQFRFDNYENNNRICHPILTPILHILQLIFHQPLNARQQESKKFLDKLDTYKVVNSQLRSRLAIYKQRCEPTHLKGTTKKIQISIQTYQGFDLSNNHCKFEAFSLLVKCLSKDTCHRCLLLDQIRLAIR